MLKAYVSSTYSDLRPYREAAFDTLARIGIQAVGMEYLSASSTLPVEQCLSTVSESDVYILIVGHRYGFIPEGFDKSITHLEYQRAVEIGILILPYVLSDDVPVRLSSIESDEKRRAQLDAFKSELHHRHITGRIQSPEQFSSILAADIVNLLGRREAKKPESSLAKSLEKCREEAERYKKVIDDLSAKLRNVVPADPIWRGRNFWTDELLCFALLPFQEVYFQVYESAVAPAAEELGLRALHAGEIFGNREVVEDIWDSICSARIVIVDVTGRNPNVFYELGICHTLGKECIVITQNKDDVPFDIRHRRFIEYKADKLATLRTTLRKTIQAVLSPKPVSGEDEGSTDA